LRLSVAGIKRMRCRIALLLAGVSVPGRDGEGQVPSSSRDSAALVQAVVADLKASYRGFADGQFVFDTTNAALGPLAVRVLAGLRTGDSVRVSRTTPRARFGNFHFAGDTAAIAVTVNFCSLEPREWFSGTDGTHRYFRTEAGWEPERRRSVRVGDGVRCPY
jgi:hypothetical protein